MHYEELRKKAEGGSITVADVFTLMHTKQISEDECRELLLLLERANESRWQRALKVFA